MGALGDIIGGTDWNSLFKPATGGLGYHELVAEGQKNYPDTPVGSRHHEEGTRRMAETLGPSVGPALAAILPQVAGLGLEGAEYLHGDPASATMDTPNDIAANARGSFEGATKGQGSILEMLGKSFSIPASSLAKLLANSMDRN